MGIGPEIAEMIFGMDLKPGFSVCDLGSQIWHPGYRKRPGWWYKGAAEFYTTKLEARRYESIDANGQGTILHDLNLPLPLPFHGAFDLATDFGTIEHIFDIGEAWRTLHYLVKPGGIIAFAKPIQGYEDHGFYNCHPTLFTDLARANNYEVGYRKRQPTDRGELILGWFRKPTNSAFRTPNQGKYVRKMKVGEQSRTVKRPRFGRKA